MRLLQFQHRTGIAGATRDAFAWHTRPGALERLTPPWENARVVSTRGGLENGAETELELRAGPLTLRWLARHQNYLDGQQFCDVQVRGPFAHWEHTHRFIPNPPDGFWMDDSIQFLPPLGFLGKTLGGPQITARLARMFRYRHEILAHDLAVHRRYSGPPLKVLISGATGLVGSALHRFLTAGGHQVIPLRRRSGAVSEVLPSWDPATGQANLQSAGPLDAVVHLAGESIAQRWTTAAKQRIRNSRIAGTRLLCETVARMPQPPQVLVCASGVGYYGDRADEWLTEESAPGTGFLPEVAQAWEAATEPARARGIRVVNLRFGMILARQGGALASMLPLFQCGLGGPLGDGRMYWSWISLDDVLGVIHHALTQPSLSGPVNAVSPDCHRNTEFTRILGTVLHRPVILPAPRRLLEGLLGEMAHELLLASTRVRPTRLLESGFAFQFADLEHALRHLLGK